MKIRPLNLGLGRVKSAKCTCGETMRALGEHGMRCPVVSARADALDEAIWLQKTRKIRHTKFGLGEDLRDQPIEFWFEGRPHRGTVIQIKRNPITGVFELYLDPPKPLPFVTSYFARVPT